MTCDFPVVLAQRPTVWALQAAAPKDTSDKPGCSTIFPHPLEGQHASHQLPSSSRALWASIKHKVLGSVKPGCSFPLHSQI